jgi:hypothetical protein
VLDRRHQRRVRLRHVRRRRAVHAEVHRIVLESIGWTN